MNFDDEQSELGDEVYERIDWGRVRGSVVTYAMVLRLPFEQIPNLEAAIAVMKDVEVAFRNTSAHHLYITDVPPPKLMRSDKGVREDAKEEENS